ncbi:hypothetical protein JCM10908_005407 [Rhodotorula pacifica]|uniref:triglyceride lipase ATG15 n=1 Tax=Rhodotorula pacifica TaxID=1495444 RepID=UPI00318084BA
MLLLPPILLALLSARHGHALQIPLHAQANSGQTDEYPTSPSSDRLISSTTDTRDRPERLLSLRHAVHLPLYERHLPASRRDYDSVQISSLASADPSLYPLLQSVKTRRIRSQRPSSQVAFQAARRHSYRSQSIQIGRIPSRQDEEDARLAQSLEWDDIEIDAPDVTSVETLAAFGKMTSNAYSLPEEGSWYDVGGGWNVTDSFGWQEDGLRGHVFADEKNETVVIAIKGTSALVVGGGGRTGHNDKVNDNLFFSCCCARVDWSWWPVCGCYDGPYQCRQTCVEEAVIEKSAYYPVATDLYNNVSAIYPHAQIWLAGHSLGGALAAMLSRTYGVPSISFEAPGDLLPARRLHLPLPPPRAGNDSALLTSDKQRSLDEELTTHVFHNADPIPMGVCSTSSISMCGIAGFALESKCHTGKKIVYDTVGKLGWSVDVRTHSIRVIVDNLLKDDWGKKPKEEPARVEEQPTGEKGFGWWPGRGKGKKPADEGGEDGGDGSHDDDDGGGGDGSRRKDDSETDDGQHGGRGVPQAVFEDEDCVDCFKWTYV